MKKRWIRAGKAKDWDYNVKDGKVPRYTQVVRYLKFWKKIK